MSLRCICCLPVALMYRCPVKTTLTITTIVAALVYAGLYIASRHFGYVKPINAVNDFLKRRWVVFSSTLILGIVLGRISLCCQSVQNNVIIQMPHHVNQPPVDNDPPPPYSEF